LYEEHNRTMISLGEWINSALKSIDTSEEPLSAFGANPRTLALSSDAFLSAALTVARSLADQICRAQEVEKYPNNGTPRQPYLPTPASDWADSVTVYLSSSDGNFFFDGDHRDLQPLPFSSDKDPSDHPKELQDMLESVIGNVPHSEKENNSQDMSSNNNPNYLSVSSAMLTSPSNNNSDNGRCDSQFEGDDMQRIYSLGLLFYELFSGGERPAEFNNPPTVPKSDTKHELDEVDQDLHSLHNQSEPIDLANNLNIFDDFGDAELKFSFGVSNGRKHDVDSSREQSKKKKPMKRTGTGQICSISVEPLKSKGLPWSLCNLIGNMLDCANGDLCGDESYRHMSDVASDLQRMLDKPRTYLDDLDLAKLAVSGLQLNETIFGREAEFASLRGAYDRSISGESELAIISGTSGTGKSVLAHRMGSFVNTRGGIFLSGKFDQLQQATPFSTLAAAFNQYCDMLISEGDTSRSKKVGAELNRALGKESFHLSRVIPSLSAVINQDVSQPHLDEGCVDAQKRLLYLLCQFVDVISSSSGAPVTLFLDDLQWADAASIEVIHQLLLISGSLNKSKQFFFFGCVREEEVNGNHPFLRMVSSVCQFGKHVTTIPLSCMDEGMVNTLISDVLRLSPRLTRSLANIVYHKTNGNQLFFSQLMISLSKDGLIRPSLSRRRWEWDEEKIQSRKLPDDVAKFITGNIGRMPANVRMALSVLSCFGASAKITFLKALETQLAISLIESMEEAAAEGVLDKTNGSYSFGHDRMQEAAYNMMRPEDRCLFHFKYGMALVACTIESNDDGMLFTATNQLNLGGPQAIKDAQHSALIANLNFTAGKKAMEMSDFRTAYNFFDNGISFLRKGHWRTEYDLSLKLFVNAAKCAPFIGNIVSLKYLSQQVLSFGNSFEDKLEVLYITVSALARIETHQAVEKAISVLSHLGEVFSESHSEPGNIRLLIEQTKFMLSEYTDERLLNHKSMEDPSKIMAMKFLAKLELWTAVTKSSWQPLITMKMVQLSIEHGMSAMSPIGFTYYGMLIASLGDIREGCRYARIGRQLLDRPGAKEVAGEVISMGTQLTCFVEPVQCANETHLQAHAAAMSAGDICNAMLILFAYSIGSYWAGEKLSVVREKFAKSRSLMEKQNHLLWLAHQTPLERTMLTLIGVDESQLPDQSVLGGKMQYTALVICFQKLYVSFMFRQYEPMKASVENYFIYKDSANTWSLVYADSARAFISGLAAYWMFRKTKDPKWTHKASKSKFMMKKWAEVNEWNFQNKLYLMEAEEAFCYDDTVSAKTLYEKAITSAREHRFINEEALSYELAGYFFLKMGQKDVSVNYFLQAHEKYHDWGAIAKANSLYEFTMSSMCASSP